MPDIGLILKSSARAAHVQVRTGAPEGGRDRLLEIKALPTPDGELRLSFLYASGKCHLRLDGHDSRDKPRGFPDLSREDSKLRSQHPEIAILISLLWGIRHLRRPLSRREGTGLESAHRPRGRPATDPGRPFYLRNNALNGVRARVAKRDDFGRSPASGSGSPRRRGRFCSPWSVSVGNSPAFSSVSIGSIGSPKGPTALGSTSGFVVSF
jgi:hypothetical protein